MEVVIPRGTTIPAKLSKIFTTVKENQNTVNFPVFEGERAFANDNHFLDEFELTEVPNAPEGVPII